ncbi:hypothetical protein M8J75_002647 [Diaphorina citri]|nr:hypothetical protein M8J75_002647 [Diaphorina citri]
MKPPIRKYSDGDDDEQSRFVFTVDPQSIITFPIDHCLYVCDICSSVLKTQDTFKKHYIKLHINHAHAALSDLKFCEAFPINLSKFKEDEGWFRCHFCIGLFFNTKSELKSHLNQHDPLQEIPEEQSAVNPDKLNMKEKHNADNNDLTVLEALTDEMTICEYSEDLEVSVPIIPMAQSVEPGVMMNMNELLPLPSPNLPIPSGFTCSLPETLATVPAKCNEEEAEFEPLSGLLGSSLLTLFNSSPNVLSDHRNDSTHLPSSLITSQTERSSSPIFAQDCPTSQRLAMALPIPSKSIKSTSILQHALEDVSVVPSYHTLTCLPDSGVSSSLTSLTSPRGSSNSSPSSSSGFSSASTDELMQIEDDDDDAFESSVVRSEESFSSLTSSKSNSDEEIPSDSKSLSDINIDNIVLSCLFCDKIFASIKSTRAHMLKTHPSKRRHWECVFCKTNFKNCDLLLNHLCSNHSDIYFACISCKVRFDTKAFMDTHFQNKHNSENATNLSKVSESKSKDDIMHQLKCIPYYTNQNVICNSLSRKIKLIVYDKLNFSNKKYNEKQVTNKSVQVSEDDISQECHPDSLALNCTGSILKRKLTEDHPELSDGNINHKKLKKDSKEFHKIVNEENNFQSKLPVSSPYTSCVDPMKEVVVEKSFGEVEEFLSDLSDADKYLMKTEAKLEFQANNHAKMLCLFCNYVSYTLKASKAHIGRIHKVKRGGKYCCYCNTKFRTLDLLFNHLCSEHVDMYFACALCKERFDSKASLLIHFQNKHDSVDINTETVNKDLNRNLNDFDKELFMFELKCLPNYPYKAICLPDCTICQHERGGKQNEHTAIPLGTSSKLPEKSSSSEVEKYSTNGDMQVSNTTAGNPLCGEESQSSLKSHHEIESTFNEPKQDETTGTSLNELDLSSMSELSNPADQMDSSSNQCESTESKISGLNLNGSVISFNSEISHLACEEVIGFVPPSKLDAFYKERICLYCERTFHNPKAYRVHLYRSHKAKKSNRCIFCETDFKFHEDLFAHMFSSHCNVYFACNICKIRFDTKGQLDEHANNMHTQVQTKTSGDDLLQVHSVPGLGVKESDKLLQDNAISAAIESGKVPVQDSSVPTAKDLDNSLEDHSAKESDDSLYAHMKPTTKESVDLLEVHTASTVLEADLPIVHAPISNCSLEFSNPELSSQPTNSNLALDDTSTLAALNLKPREPLPSNSVSETSNSELSSQPTSKHILDDTNPLAALNLKPRETSLPCGSTTSNPGLSNEPTCSKLALEDTNTPAPNLESAEKTDETSLEIYKHKQLIQYKHPEYENIAMRNYSSLDITVQLQILNRVKEFCRTNGKQHSTNLMKRPQRQQKYTGFGGKREFSGEWARAKNYFCANCGSHFVNFWDFDVHRWNAHPNVACSVYDFYVEDTPPCYFEETSWPYNRVPKSTFELPTKAVLELKACTKCGKTFMNVISFHKHLITCAQHNKVQNKAKRISWKEQDKPNKRKRRSCRGLKSILDTPPKLPPNHVFTTNSRKTSNGVQKRLLADKTNRRLSFYSKNVNKAELQDSKGDFMLTRSQSAISNIDEKTKELIEKFERGKYNHNNAESFSRRLTKPKPKDCS